MQATPRLVRISFLSQPENRTRAGLIWAGLIAILLVPVVAASQSPYLQWRDPIYIASGFAGIIGLAVLALQPLLASRLLPGLAPMTSRRIHRIGGAALVGLVVGHVFGLWLTSPPDVVDALLFRSPTPFSVWGVIAMWAIFLAAALVMLRRRLRISPTTWKRGHKALVVIAVAGTALHALLIEGAMEPVSKAMLCGVVVAALVAALFRLRRSS